jgi:hypothetical protein
MNDLKLTMSDMMPRKHGDWREVFRNLLKMVHMEFPKSRKVILKIPQFDRFHKSNDRGFAPARASKKQLGIRK